ncbi:hypothetical protein [Actinomadura sp. CNU-125]|uniref:hypothetical protein n=1 Tax=Actinomadura sp. CNU-125 TaxID=1904961 RepID=UPI000ABF6675|nr:hypothetical protein [Actinomadura sp. CNU-125]
MSVEDVFELMRRADELPYGEARTVLVEDALRRADAAGDEVLAFRVRIALTNAYHYGAEPAKAFATFSRTLADHDRDPGRFDETHSLLWQMKAVVNSLTKFPEIPLDRTHAVLDDMERRYRAGGHSLQAVYHYRCAVARHVGDESALDWFAKWRAAERDGLSDCAGCDPTGMMYQLIDAGRFEEALEIAAPVLDAELTCSEQPQGVQTALMQVYLRTGRPAEAADMHRRAYRVNRTQLADLADIGEHLEFCGLTGNEARGLEILERHLGWLDRAPNPHAAMGFAAAAALVLAARRRRATGRRRCGDRRRASRAAATSRWTRCAPSWRRSRRSWRPGSTRATARPGRATRCGRSSTRSRSASSCRWPRTTAVRRRRPRPCRCRSRRTRTGRSTPSTISTSCSTSPTGGAASATCSGRSPRGGGSTS